MATSSNTSLSSLQQRILAIKTNHTSSNLTAEFTDYTSDKTWLSKISEDGNQPEDWLEYLNDLEKRGSNSNSSLNAMYNKAIRDIPVYKHKKNDNYATILINSARLRASQDIDEARTLFKFARANIRFLARIHIAAAQLELDIGDKCKCRSVLCKGIEVGATPVDLLKTALTRLENGMKILNPQVNDCIVTDVAMITNHQQTAAVSTIGSSEPSRSMSHDHSEDSTNTASYLQVDPSISLKKRQRNPSDNRTEDTDTMLILKRQINLSQSDTKQTPSSQSLLASTTHGTMHKMRKTGNSNTSLMALQQRITALKANNIADYTDNMETDKDNDKTVLSKIAEDGNQPDDWLAFLKDLEKRTSNNTSSLNAMYNKAIHDIPVYKHKKSDDYATILINSARLRATQDVDDARTLFKFARANIRLFARIHVAAAQLELDIGDQVKCKSILCKGIEVGATPADLLKTALTRLEAGEKVLNTQDTEFISDLSLATGHQKASTIAQNNSMQMNSSNSRLDDTDTTVWLKRQQYLSQSATKQPCITPLTKPPLSSASTASKPKMRSLGAPMRVKREVLPSVDEDDHDDNKSFLHGIAPLNNRHSSRSDSSDNTDTSLHNTFPSLTFSMLGRTDHGKNEHKKQTSSQLFSSPNESIVQNQQIPDASFQHSKLKNNTQNPPEPASNINSQSKMITAASISVSTPNSLPVVPPSPVAPVLSYLPVSATPSTVVPSDPSPAPVLISHPPIISPPPDIKKPSPVNTTPQVVTSTPVISPPIVKDDSVISPPVSHPAPVISFVPPLAPSTVPPPMIPNVLQSQVRSQPPMQIDQNKNVIYVNNKQYTVLKLVGKGGSSKVYQVYSADLKNVLAIKRVDLELADDLTKQGYINEITLLTQLQKKTEKIIKLYDFELTDSFIFMVMECGSIDLSTFLRRNKNISEDKIRFYWREMLETVNVIHQEGIVHSDLKPANFLFVEATLKLIDFGIANAIQVDQTSVLRDQQIGTLNYMSPEAIQDTSPPPQMDSTGRRKPRLKINCRSDVWSLGCILYYMVYGKTPFQHITNGLMKLQAIIDPNHEIQFPDINNKDLHDVLKKCLIRNPKQRPSIDTLLEHPFLLNKTQDDVTSSTESGTCKLSAGQLEALISQLSTVRVHSPRTMSAISNAKALIEQLQKGSTTKSDQDVSGSCSTPTPVVEMPPPISQPPPKQARMACRQPLQSVNMVDIQKAQVNMKPVSSLHRHEIDDKENFGIRESIVNP